MCVLLVRMEFSVVSVSFVSFNIHIFFFISIMILKVYILKVKGVINSSNFE